MKRNTLVLAALLAGSVAVTAANELSKAEISALQKTVNRVAVPELPATAAGMIGKASKDSQAVVALQLVELIAAKNPASMAAVVGAMVKASPTLAEAVADRAAELVPAEAAGIARAASASAPASAEKIAATVAKRVPKSSREVAAGVIGVVPVAGHRITAAVAEAVPAASRQMAVLDEVWEKARTGADLRIFAAAQSNGYNGTVEQSSGGFFGPDDDRSDPENAQDSTQPGASNGRIAAAGGDVGGSE